MKLLPDSIRTRTILVLLIGLTVSHLGSTLVYSSDREQALAEADERLFADRLSTLTVVIENTPAPVRRQVANAISSAGLEVSWGPTTDVPEGRVQGDPGAAIRTALKPHFGDIAARQLRVEVGPVVSSGAAAALHALHGMQGHRQIGVAIELPDESWITYRRHIPAAVSAWSLNALLSTLVMVAATLVLSIWATGWITAPLASFARAAQRLGVDVSAPPLPEDGPKEVRAAAHAFNQMQQRIRSFVEDRLQMLAAISHDLRTPITRLRLRTEQLPLAAETQTKMLNDLDEMEQMVASSLAFAKDEAAEEPRQSLDLAALLGSLCDAATDAGDDAEYAWSGRLIYRGRPLALKRLFTNLIQNAVRYGGSAKVSADSGPQGVRVVVEDSGPGIPEKQLEAVFRPFYRLDQSRNKRTGGVGLGLANARGIARAHGGDVVLENRPAGGLRAVVTLPHIRGEDRPAGEPAAAGPTVSPEDRR